MSQLTGRQVREALFVLIHQNLALHEISEDKNIVVQESLVVYRLDVDSVFARLAYPLFASIVEQNYGKDVRNNARITLSIFKGWGNYSGGGEKWKNEFKFYELDRRMEDGCSDLDRS